MNHLSSAGLSALGAAAYAGETEIAKALLAAGAGPDRADPGTSPLTEALDRCRPALVRLLIARGARVVIAGARDRCGTPEHPAPPALRDLLARTKLDVR